MEELPGIIIAIIVIFFIARYFSGESAHLGVFLPFAGLLRLCESQR
jgi:hypothetical protein